MPESNWPTIEECEGWSAEGIRRSKPVYFFIKRVFDILFSLLLMVLLSPLFLIIAIAIKVEDPKGPIIFKQDRIGEQGKPFKMYKFRSMIVDAEKELKQLMPLNERQGPVFKMKDDPRVTKVGKVIRKFSADELPQFVNVLKNDMSIVGPRPALTKEFEAYSEHHKKRLLVPQGLTCYWQTRLNRDSLSFEESVNLDLLYIKKCGFWSDFKLIIQTIGVVLMGQGR